MQKDEEIGEPCLSVIMAAYNEQGTIFECVRRVLEQTFVGELIIVDDASTDDTQQIITGINDERVKVLIQDKNRGKGAALRRGFKEATFPFVGIQDADLEYDPKDLALLLKPLLDGRADVVYGSRFVTGDAHRVLFFWHSIGNKFLTLASNMVSNLNLTDMETCYKVFRRELIQALNLEQDRFGFEPEVTIKTARLGARFYEVGISYSGRSYTEGKKIGWRDGFNALYCISKYGARARDGLTTEK